MSPRRDSHQPVRPLAGGMVTLIRHAKSLVFIPLIVTVLIGGTYWGWQVVRRSGAETVQYAVLPGDIEVEPQCKWITSQQLLGDVVRDASLDDRLSLLDERLTERVGLAFGAHPWVERVAEVEKFHPARIRVTLVYREPVAVVRGTLRDYPVDGHGVPLPIADFAPEQLRGLARIRGVPVKHPATYGEPWPDPRVVGGAKIAATFGQLWHEFGLVAIDPSSQPIHGDSLVYTYQLVTRSGTRIRWGPQYLVATPAEPTAEEKRNRLKAYVDRYGPLDSGTTAPSLETDRTATQPRKVP